MIGKTLKHLRVDKGFSLRKTSEGILSPSQLSKIENNAQIPSSDKFLHLLSRMNINYDEFCLYSDDAYLKIRNQLNTQIDETLRKNNLFEIKKLINELEDYERKFFDDYFMHMKCILKASYTLLLTNNDYKQARSEIEPVVEYLNSIENWYSYEFLLFNNSLFFFDIDRAISIGDKALKNIKRRYLIFKDDEMTRRLLNNLAIYTLTDKKYYMQSYYYSSTAIGLPKSTKHIYNTIYAKIINQVACYKLDNIEFNPQQLSNLINWFLLINMEDIYKEVRSFVEGHGIKLDE